MATEYDILVIGGGGAGLTAALYAARGDLKTIVFEKNAVGGQIAITDEVENYPGFPEGIMGPDIGMKMEEQAIKYGAQVSYEEVLKIEKNGDSFSVTTDQKTYTAWTVIVASGATARRLNVPGEEDLIGKGVSYCAVCDAPFFRNKTVAVIGGGDSAIQEALFLTKFAAKVYIVHRRDALRASKVLQERAFANEKIEIVWDSVVDSIEGSPLVNTVNLKNVKTEKVNPLSVDGVFIFVGHDPNVDLVKDLVACDESGYVKTNDSYETTIEGMYACGEVRSGATWQLVAACGEGCSASLHAQHYVEEKVTV